MLGGKNIEKYNLISSWKKEYGAVSRTEVQGIDFYFRHIKRSEYETIRTVYEDTLIMDEKIAELCVLDPIVEDWGGEVYAGFSNTLARVILEESLEIRKPGEPNNYLQMVVNQEYEDVSNNFGRQMPAIILRAFPAYKIEDIENMPLRRQVEIYTQAIWVLNEIEPQSYGITFADDEEKE